MQVGAYNTGLAIHPALVVKHITEHYRQFNAILHRVAALVEEATDDGEGWIVEMSNNTVGCIHLELATDARSERDRATQLLKSIARTFGRKRIWKTTSRQR